jgi:hypothetical protein
VSAELLHEQKPPATSPDRQHTSMRPPGTDSIHTGLPLTACCIDKPAVQTPPPLRPLTR